MNATVLAESHMQLVRRLARRVARTLPPHVGVDDLVGAGALGLVDAARKYDPSRGIAFDAYASIRIRGAIIDQLRAIDFVPRKVRGRDHTIEKTRQAAVRAGRPGTDDEVEIRLGIAPGELRDWSALGRPSFVAYDSAAEDDQGIPSTQPAVDEVVEGREMISAMRGAITRLPEKLQTVLSLYYVEGLTLREIGQVLGVTESRVCQMHGVAVLKLRELLS
jgi:RNA polymerase sigma factor for flagellar operon FliA